MLISIVIPVYNRETVIRKTLDSILAQANSSWECLLVDDHSSDNSKSVIREYTLRDNRFLYYPNERKKGAQGARNTGILHANSEWICIFDSDDYMHPQYVDEMIKGISDSVDVVVCHSDVINIATGEKKSQLSPICYGNIEDSLYNRSVYVPNNQTLIRKSKIFEMGLLDEECPSMQEWDTHLRLSKICRYNTVEKVLVDYYVGGKDTISSNKNREIIGRQYILKKHIKGWKMRPLSLFHFVNQIYSLISINEDYVFNKEAVAELKKIDKLILFYLPIYVFLKKFLNFSKAV